MYKFETRVRYSECDSEGKLTVAGLINLLQDTATLHSEDLNVGLSYVQEHNMGWFVTTYHLDFFRRPRMGEYISCATYPYQFRGFVGCRAYVVTDASGNILANCNSTWALMDLGTIRPVHVPQEMLDAYSLDETPENIPGPIRLRPEAELCDVGSFTVTRDMLDTNSHMNNGKYISVMEGFLPEDFAFINMKMAFKKALHLDDEVLVKSYINDDVVKIYFYLGEDVSCIGEFSR